MRCETQNRNRLRSFAALVLLCAALVVALPAPAVAAPQRVKTRRIIIEVTARHGFGRADQRAMLELAERESGTSTTPHTGSYYGLFQIPIRKWDGDGHHGALRWIGRNGRWKDPVLNTEDALRYIRKRYRTPRRALAHSRSHGWY